MANEEHDVRGEAVVFWAWAGAITAGLVAMITIPLVGRGSAVAFATMR